MLWSSESRIDLQRLQIYAPFHLGLLIYRAVGTRGSIAYPPSPITIKEGKGETKYAKHITSPPSEISKLPKALMARPGGREIERK